MPFGPGMMPVSSPGMSDGFCSGTAARGAAVRARKPAEPRPAQAGPWSAADCEDQAARPSSRNASPACWEEAGPLRRALACCGSSVSHRLPWQCPPRRAIGRRQRSECRRTHRKQRRPPPRASTIMLLLNARCASADTGAPRLADTPPIATPEAYRPCPLAPLGCRRRRRRCDRPPALLGSSGSGAAKT